MKLKHLLPPRYRKQVIRQFGQAKLVQLPNGQYELWGGSTGDRTAAFEWASLFAHEIVFTHFLRKTDVRCRSRKPALPTRLQPVI